MRFILQQMKNIRKLEKEVDQRNNFINQQKEKLEQLKQSNLEGNRIDQIVWFIYCKKEKKRHSEINNQIIRSNVRYQKSLTEAQTKLQEVTLEKDQLLGNSSQKEIGLAVLKVIIHLEEYCSVFPGRKCHSKRNNKFFNEADLE